MSTNRRTRKRPSVLLFDSAEAFVFPGNFLVFMGETCYTVTIYWGMAAEAFILLKFLAKNIDKCPYYDV